MDPQFELIVGVGLAIMIAASVFARRTGLAPPLLLVGFGIAVSYLPGTPAIELDPELILAGVLPPLLYSSAVNLPVMDLRRNLALISWLSIGMVIISALAIGFVVHWIFPDISLPLAIALGAVVSPTDAVAATAIGRRVGLPPRLMAVLEGESLLNDASALVVLRAGLAGIAATTEFSLTSTIGDFVWAVIGAGLIGFAVGVLTSLLRARLGDPVLNTTISFAVPFLAYVPAEEVGASGVLAVVVAGIATGAIGSRRFSARDRQTQSITWTTINFLLEGAVFVAMGYQLPELLDAARNETSRTEIAALVAVVLTLLVGLRFLGLAGPALRRRRADRERERSDAFRARLDQFAERLDAFTPSSDRDQGRLEWAQRRLARSKADIAFAQREPITSKGTLVLGWAGMRGVVTVAAVQTIPAHTPQRATVVLAAFLVALITLIGFGVTLPWVISRLNFTTVSAEERRTAVEQLVRQIGTTAIDKVGPIDEQLIDDEPVDPAVVERLKGQVLPRLLAGLPLKPYQRPDMLQQSMIIQLRYLEAMREALAAERSIGAYSSETFRAVESVMDAFEQRVGRN